MGRDRLGVVIVTHRSEAVVTSCLTALPEHLFGRTAVVDNASDDATVQCIAAAGVRLLRQDRNLGFAAAANRGAAAVDADILCFLNPDCTISPEQLEEGRAAVANGAACAVPHLAEPGGTLIPGRQPGYTALKLLADTLETSWGVPRLVGGLRARRGYDDPSWWWPHGACTFVDRNLFSRLGGFDERFFLYMEDVDFGRRLSLAGATIAQLASIVEHRLGHGARVPHLQRLSLLNRGRARYAAIHFGRLPAVGLHLVAGPAMLARRALRRDR